MSVLLPLGRRLQALSQTGLQFAENPFDRERYEELAIIAADLIAADPDFCVAALPAHDPNARLEGKSIGAVDAFVGEVSDGRTYRGGAPPFSDGFDAGTGVSANAVIGATPLAERLLASWHGEHGYATPKIDVRGVVFKDDKVLLVRERSDGKWTLPGGWADVNEQPREAVEKEIREESGYIARAAKLAALLDRDRHNPPPYLFHIWKVFFICDLVGGEARTSIETDGVDFFALDALPPLSEGRTTAAQIRRMHEHHVNRTLPADFE